MRYAAVFALAFLFAPLAHAADAPTVVFTFTDAQAAVIMQLAAEKRAAAAQIYNQANDLIAEIEKQAAQKKSKDEGRK